MMSPSGTLSILQRLSCSNKGLIEALRDIAKNSTDAESRHLARRTLEKFGEASDKHI